ncbi:hypothetical protein AAFC00_000007 [Neodothiora populina]|uniref:Uncharacterized protein n=1 Tax=Neodothiora populina TaxID=2781224 RepID=A0ABR3P2C1_9PEZI
MKFFQSLFVATAGISAVSQAYVVDIYDTKDCTGSARSINVYDNTCKYPGGFQSLKVTTQGGSSQQLTAYSRQACAGAQTLRKCVHGPDSVPVGQCFQTTNGNGGSNALSSYSSAGDCPN